MFCAADNSTPKMVAAGSSKPLLPMCEELHNITKDIFIVTTVRTTDLTMAFSFYFSVIWKGESFEVQAYLHLFRTQVMKTVYTCILCQFSASNFIFSFVACPKYGRKNKFVFMTPTPISRAEFLNGPWSLCRSTYSNISTLQYSHQSPSTTRWSPSVH